MTLLATAASHSGTGAGTLALLALITAAVYLIHCAVWPFRPCRYCQGGRFRSPTGRAWRPCRYCGGSGAKIRAGRRIWTYLTNTRDRDRRTR